MYQFYSYFIQISFAKFFYIRSFYRKTHILKSFVYFFAIFILPLNYYLLIFNSGGSQAKVTDASLDPAEKKTNKIREELIRQLGEAMGVIGTSKGSVTSGSGSSASSSQQSVVNAKTNQAIVDPSMSQAVGVMDGGMLLEAGLTGTSQASQHVVGLTGINSPSMEMRGMFGNIVDTTSKASQQTVTNKGSEKDMLATLMDATSKASNPTVSNTVSQGSNTQTIIDTGSQMESNMFGPALDSVAANTGVDPSLQHMLASLTDPNIGLSSQQTVVTSGAQQNMLDTSSKSSMQTVSPKTKQGMVDASLSSSMQSQQIGSQQKTVEISGTSGQTQQIIADSTVSASGTGSQQVGTTRQPQSALDFVDMGM